MYKTIIKLINKLRLEEIKHIKDLNAPQTTLIHSGIIQKKLFLKRLYSDFYKELRDKLPEKLEEKYIVELGSGGGFTKEVIPNVVTSDVLPLPTVDKVFSAMDMPMGDQSVDAFIMIDVLHHINDTRKFFREVNRCLKTGGKVIMIEPANTWWSRLIYKNFHSESFDPHGGWGFENNGALTSANSAIPWIVFYRDRIFFENEFNTLIIKNLKIHTPFRYLISGGLKIKQLLPSCFYGSVVLFEKLLSPFNRYIGMFLTIELLKKDKINNEKNVSSHQI